MAVDELLAKMKIYQHLVKIREGVNDPFYIRAYLFEKGILSQAEYDCLTSDRRAQCQQLVDILDRQKPEQLPFCHLLVALKQPDVNGLKNFNADDLGTFCYWLNIQLLIKLNTRSHRNVPSFQCCFFGCFQCSI